MSDTEWFEGVSTDDKKHARAYWRRVGLLLFLALAAVMLLLPLGAYAGPVAEAHAGEARVVLTDDACKMEAVANLKHRATWHEKGKVYEGCYGVHPYGVVLAYFADKTVVILPVDIFQKVSGA